MTLCIFHNPLVESGLVSCSCLVLLEIMIEFFLKPKNNNETK
jgi:hypothetical protein